MKRALVAIMMAALLAGCGQTTARVQLAPGPNECQISETRMAMSTTTVAVCWDQGGRALGMAGGSGKPIISVPLEAAGAGATVTGAAIMGGAIRKAVGLGGQQTEP